jgi:uncharacterized protein (TIGR03118 family)
MQTWLTRLWSGLRRPRVPKPAPRYRPQVEGLDDRLVLSGFFRRLNLVADQAGRALLTDPNLVNGWGIALAPGANFWVADNVTGKSSVYNGDVNGLPFAISSLVVSIPGGKPTGVVFNSTSEFVVSSGGSSGPALFIFVSESGQITGWNPAVPLPAPSTQAQNGVTVPGAVFKGVALANDGSRNLLYAADFAGRQIRVFDGTFTATTVPGGFLDARIPRNFAPFNIQNLGGKLYVTYAKKEAGGTDDVPGPGTGFVDVFDTSGHLLRRLASHGTLNAPWGLALAPAGLGKASNKLLVGNFGDGTINVFNPNSGHFLGQLANRAGRPIKIDGLWGLTFGNGTTAGQSNVLYFAAGPDDEAHGLFGSLTAVRNGRLAMRTAAKALFVSM